MEIKLTRKQINLLRNWIEYAKSANEENADPYHNPNSDMRKELILENQMLSRIENKLIIASIILKAKQSKNEVA